MSDNPYQPPETSEQEGGRIFDRHALVEIVRGWERLRLLYNAILLVPGIGVLWLWTSQSGMPWVVAIVGGVMVAIGANFAFLLGPAAEMYFRALFRKGEPIGRGRLLIFGAGVVVSAGVFLVVSLPGMMFI